ncbi:MAG: hypothetical protein COW71_02505 [Ignavibacteriales bacterium CG18_big_fil_WC_8_21_14_2_50_31_20]|nr:MAG: hypothetical protein COW71_02505 [Ignavibacteriales bacterium CG18_big_fil_WC_8_21_14_2_50_31_20]
MAQHKGSFEYMKFDDRRKSFGEYVDFLKSKDIPLDNWMEHFTCYIGHMSLSRVLGLYELYKKTLGVSGHIGEIGIYKGASFFLFAKLIKIFESESLTQVHGFDWFQGTGDDDIKMKIEQGGYKQSYDEILEMNEKQGFSNLAFIHKMDVVEELEGFLEENLHLQFKLFFMDAGTHKVVKAALPLIWERMTPGGIVILDQFNHELSPGETLAVREVLPNAKVKIIPNIWMPSGYIIKE